MAASSMTVFRGVIIAMLFFSFAITIVTYILPDDSLVYVESFSALAGQTNLSSSAEKIQGSLESQTNIPVVEVGALVFYSGNILLDLLLNFVFAVPEMIGLIIHGFMSLVNIDTYIWTTIQLFASVATVTFYLIGLIEMVTNIRTGRVL